jgi:hypothetical protein
MTTVTGKLINSDGSLAMGATVCFALQRRTMKLVLFCLCFLSCVSFLTFGQQPAGSGLTLNIAGGTAFCSGTLSVYAGGTVTLAANATNYVYLDPSANCAPNSNTAGFAAGQIPIAVVVTGATAISSVFVSQSSGANLQTNGASNALQTSLNLQSGTDITLSNQPGTGNVAFNFSGVLPSAQSAAANQFLTGYNAGTGAFTLAQPTFGNIAGTISASQIATSPVSGDCPQWNGSALIWSGCGGFANWTQNGTSGTVLGQPPSGQDAVVQRWEPSVSNPSSDIIQAYLPGATPSINCATNSKCAFAVQANGSLYMSGNTFSLGSVDQPTASYLSLPGGTPGQGYLELSSAALNPPLAPSVSLASGGSLPVGYSTPVKITYVNGAGETLASATNIASATTSGNQAVVVTSPAPETNATGYSVYVQAGGGNWYGPSNASPVAIGTNYTITSIPTSGGLPPANTTGGLYNTFLSMSAEGSGVLCSLSSAPGQDCASGTNLLTPNNLIAGSNIAITPGSNGNVTIASTSGPITFSNLTGGTNTSAAMLVGTGASLGPTASGTVTANAYSGTLSNSSLAGSGSTTVNSTTCTLGSSCNPTGGSLIHTSSYTVALSDDGGMVVMNCSSACTVTLPNPQPASKWYARILSIGSTTATLALASSMTWNGGSSAPVLNSFRLLTVYADSTNTSNYYGEAPLAAGNNVTLTPSPSGFMVAANGGPVTTTHYIPLEACEPDQTGYSFYSVAPQTTWFEGHWEMVAGQASAIYCRVRIPHAVASTPGGNLVLTVSANDSTAGHTANFQTCDSVVSATINVGPLSCATAQSFTTTTASYAPVTLSFPVQSPLAADEFLVVKIATSASGTAPAANMHVWPYLEINETE